MKQKNKVFFERIAAFPNNRHVAGSGVFSAFRARLYRDEQLPESEEKKLA
jgi:hypothetical protein